MQLDPHALWRRINFNLVYELLNAWHFSNGGLSELLVVIRGNRAAEIQAEQLDAEQETEAEQQLVPAPAETAEGRRVWRSPEPPIDRMQHKCL